MVIIVIFGAACGNCQLFLRRVRLVAGDNLFSTALRL